MTMQKFARLQFPRKTPWLVLKTKEYPIFQIFWTKHRDLGPNDLSYSVVHFDPSTSENVYWQITHRQLLSRKAKPENLFLVVLKLLHIKLYYKLDELSN